MKNPWPMGIAAVIVFFVLGMLGLVRMAVRAPDDLVREDHYDRAVGYQQDLNRERVAAQITAGSLAHFVAGTGLVITLPAGATDGRIELYRPSDASLDRTMNYVPDAQDRQIIPPAALQPGNWRIRLTWKQSGAPAQKEIAFYASP